MTESPAIVILGADASLGDRQPHARLSGRNPSGSILARTVRNALATRLPVIAVIAPEWLDEISLMLPARDIVILDGKTGPPNGRGVSIASGIACCASAGGWLLLPGDMPLVRPAHLHAVAAALEQAPVAYAQHRGRRGHPWGFGAELFSELIQLPADDGVRRVMARYPSIGVEIAHDGVLIRIDSLEDLAALEQRCEKVETP